MEPVVVIFKSTCDELKKDRYQTVLVDNNIAHAILVPTLSFQFQLDELRTCLQDPDAYSGLILTSQRSVEAVSSACNNNGSGTFPSGWRTKRHFCVGIQTRDSAINLLGLTDVTGHECGNADLLANVIIDEVKPGSRPLLFPCSSLKMDTLPRFMEQQRIAFRAVTSYATVPHPHLDQFVRHLAERVRCWLISIGALVEVKEINLAVTEHIVGLKSELNSLSWRSGLFLTNKPSCLAFFSPSGVDFTVPLLVKYGLLNGTKVISIGRTTSAALEKVSIAVDQICAKPTPEHFLETVKLTLRS